MARYLQKFLAHFQEMHRHNFFHQEGFFNFYDLKNLFYTAEILWRLRPQRSLVHFEPIGGSCGALYEFHCHYRPKISFSGVRSVQASERAAIT
jgi:hypothetical protein